MGRFHSRPGISRVSWFLILIGLIFALVSIAPIPASAATGTIIVSGTVSCQWHPVVGVYVESGGGGSGWADWTAVDARHTNIATYQAKIQNTTLPTNIRLHVGCGGSPSAWWSDNRTGSTSQAGGQLIGSTVLNAVCNEGTVQPQPGDNQRCWFGYASAAAAWAIRHLTGPGSIHAVTGDVVGNNPAVWESWSGYCLVFAVAAYWSSKLSNVMPIVSTDAADMYNTYQVAGLVHSASETPPVGALVFYPQLGGSQGHIGISVGENYIISATKTTNPPVWQQLYNSFGSGQYKGWAYPTTAFR